VEHNERGNCGAEVKIAAMIECRNGLALMGDDFLCVLAELKVKTN
jgi:hypothetical protein